MTATWTPVVEWVRRCPDVSGRAAYATATRCAVPRADADDAVQAATVLAWELDARARSEDDAVRWLRRRARAVLADARGGGVDEDAHDQPSGWTASAAEARLDAAVFGRVALAAAGHRTDALLACLSGRATLAEAGEVMGGLTRERVRQCRDSLLEHLRTWIVGRRLTRRPATSTVTR